jgi:hypothetical protein
MLSGERIDDREKGAQSEQKDFDGIGQKILLMGYTKTNCNSLTEPERSSMATRH